MASVLLLGCGDLGLELGARLAKAGHSVVGIKRTHSVADFPLFYADLLEKGSVDRALEVNALRPDIALITPTPASRDEAGYQAMYDCGIAQMLESLRRSNPGCVPLFVSSTSVYPQQQGEWVDEDSRCDAEHFRGRWVRHGEEQVQAAFPRHLILRFSGIYGPGRNRQIQMLETGSPQQKDPPYYTNRIHREDCVGVMEFSIDRLLRGETLPQILLASDSDPAPQWLVSEWLAQRTGLPVPTAKPFDARAVQNKRCNNARLLSLGYGLRYPSFRDGYAAQLASAESPQ